MPELSTAHRTSLEQVFGNKATFNTTIREQHGRDQSYHPGASPDAVVFAHDMDDIVRMMHWVRDTGVPLIPFGTGTSLEGHTHALHGGVSLDLSQMNKVLEVHAEDGDVRVQAGVTRKQLNTELRHTGMFFPIDPGADASLGGMAATAASGTNAVRYGTMRQNVTGLTVVTLDGKVTRTGTRSKKSSAGYDLTRLFVGSEGTLGVIAEVGLRIYGIPEAISSAVCQFETLEGAVNAVIETIQYGLPVARIELLDPLGMKAAIQYAGLNHLKPLPTLFIEFHGTHNSVQEQSSAMADITDGHGGGEFLWSTREEERNKLWQARHDALWAGLALRPGCRGISTDVCVPISTLADNLLEAHRDLEEHGLIAPMVGHVGDGNFHTLILVDESIPGELDKAKAANARMIDRALAYGGTCTGEHGVGSGKIGFLEKENPEAVAMMGMIKRTFDPQNLLNPGKVLRPENASPVIM